MSEESVVEQVLAARGMVAVRLPEAAHEQADWLVTLPEGDLLIEEKIKFDDPRESLARQESHLEGGVHGQSTPLVFKNRLSAITRKGASQLAKSGDSRPNALRLIWLTGVGYDAEATAHQFIATLYGSTKIIGADDKYVRTCYFFRNSDFYRHRSTLDGAVAAHQSGNTTTVRVCLNPYSFNCEALRRSPLATAFPKGLVDPTVEEADGEAYVVDSHVDRTDPSAVLQHLQSKYGRPRLMQMPMRMLSASVAISREGL